MSLNKASIAVALAAFLAVGGIAGQALAAPHDGHDGHWRQQRSYQDCIYQALTQEKKAQYDAIMKEFADKTAPLRDKLAAKYIELRTLGNTALAGAAALTLDPAQWQRIRTISRACNYLELSGRADFAAAFTGNLSFPQP